MFLFLVPHTETLSTSKTTEIGYYDWCQALNKGWERELRRALARLGLRLVIRVALVAVVFTLSVVLFAQ